MKTLILKSLDKIQGQKIVRDGNEFTVKTIVPAEEISKLRANFVELDPGKYAYSYHYHETNEEMFYIISGVGVVRTIDREIEVKAGDVIGFPTGEKGTHVMTNRSEKEKLVYIDFGTTIAPEIVHLPDSKKIMVIGKEVNGVYDK